MLGHYRGLGTGSSVPNTMEHQVEDLCKTQCAVYERSLKEKKCGVEGGAWVAQSVEHSTLGVGSGPSLRIVKLSLALWWVLSMEPV